MRVAIRRIIRVGDNVGLPLEDIGVIPDVTYQLTRDDLTSGNSGLINEAAEIYVRLMHHD